MSALGIELCDVGVHAVLMEDSGASRSLLLDGDSERFPAYAYSNDGEVEFGNSAREASMVYPRRVCSEFLDDLSFQASHMEGVKGRLTYSQLAYSFIKGLKDRSESDGDEIEKVVMAVPGHYIEANEKSEERLGLLLGILGDLELPVTGIVDMAAASLYSEGLWNVPEGQTVFHVDLHLHATHITVFNKRIGLERIHFSRLPQHGFGKMQELFSGALANRFLKQTSFDITADRKIERAFHSQTWDMLLNLGRVGEASLEVATREKSRQMTVSKEIATIDLAPQVKMLNQMLLRAVNDFAESGSSVQIVLSERAAMIHGFKEAIQDHGIGEVRALPSESAAFGAANYAKNWPLAEGIDEVRVETGISFEDTKGSDPDGRQVLGSISLIQEGKSLNPTHIVCDGLAYALGADVFVIGVGEDESFDLVVDRKSNGDSVELCRLVKENDRFVLAEAKGAVVESKSISGLKAGDFLEVKALGRRKRLLLIHCVS